MSTTPVEGDHPPVDDGKVGLSLEKKRFPAMYQLLETQHTEVMAMIRDEGGAPLSNRDEALTLARMAALLAKKTNILALLWEL